MQTQTEAPAVPEMTEEDRAAFIAGRREGNAMNRLASELPASAPEIVSKDALEQLLEVIDAVRARPASEVVRLGGMRPSPGAERIAEATGRVCVAVDGEAVLVRPASNCTRCNGSPAFRFRAMRKGAPVSHPCECVSKQVRKVAPAPVFPTMAEKAAKDGNVTAPAATPPAPVSTLADERRAHLTRRLDASKRSLDEAVTRMADALGPHEANVAERTQAVAGVKGEVDGWRAEGEILEGRAEGIRDEIAWKERRIAMLRGVLATCEESVRAVGENYVRSEAALADATRNLDNAVAERDKVARRRQKDVDRAAEEVARIEARIARECGGTSA